MPSTPSAVLITALWMLQSLVVDSKTVFFDTFNPSEPLNVGANNSDYFFFANPPTFVGNDGKVVQNTNGTVSIDIRPVKLTLPANPFGTLDHVKNLILNKNYWAVNSSQVLSCELRTWTKTFGTENNPFGRPAVTDVSRDLRLGTCGIVMLDTNTFVVADFLQTDKENLPFHERLGFGQDKSGKGLGFYHGFSSVRMDVSKRHDPFHYQTLKTEYDRGAGTLKWYVDGKLIHTVTTIGIPTPNMIKMIDLGGNTTKPVDPQGFLCGFACFTLLDFTNPLDRKSDEGLAKNVDTPGFYVKPTSFVDPTAKATSRLWKGLGLLANHAQFKVDISDRKKKGIVGKGKGAGKRT